MKYLALIAAVGLSSCTTTTPAPVPKFKFYTLDVFMRKLNGPTEAEDRSLNDCLETPETKAPCYVIKREDYRLLRKALVDLANRAQACEQVPVSIELQ